MKQLWLICLPLLAVAADARDRMAVLDLVPSSFDHTEALLLSQRLRYEFDEMDRFNLVERSDLSAFLEGKGVDSATCGDTCLQAIGRALGAEWVVSGSIRMVGDKVHVQGLLYEVKNRFNFAKSTRKADYDLERLRDKEMRRLARELVPADGGSTGLPWWLVILGAGGGAAWYATQGGDDTTPGGGNGNGGGDPSFTGSAMVTGTFPAP